MTRLQVAAALAGCLAVLTFRAAPAPAQSAVDRPSSEARDRTRGEQSGSRNIIIDYVEPIRPEFLDIDKDDPNYAKYEDEYREMNEIRTRLQKWRLLEELGAFLAPVRLSGSLRLVAKECGTINAFYNKLDRSITLCYEEVRLTEKIAPRSTTEQGISRTDAIVGSAISTLLHESGHALYNLLQIPILGREEDAADQIAAYVMLQFGRDVARMTIKGAAWFWLSVDRLMQDSANPRSDLADEHSTPRQRFVTFLCMAYGKDPEGFKDFVNIGWLPAQRSAECAREYAQADLAFRKTVLPYVDADLMKQVLAKQWVRPDATD